MSSLKRSYAIVDPRLSKRAKVEESKNEAVSVSEETPINWSVDDVINWMKSIKFDQFTDIFREKEINGTRLLALTVKDMREMGIKTVEERFKLFF